MTLAFDAIVVDLDGTLLDRAGHVSARNLRALDLVRHAGCEVLVATGRAPAECTDLLASFEHDGELIAASGALLCDNDGTTLQRRLVDRTIVEFVVEAVTESGHRALVLKDPGAVGYDYLAVGDAPFHAASTWWFQLLDVELKESISLDDDLHPLETVRVGAVGDATDLGPLAEHLEQSLGDVAFVHHWSAVTESHATGSCTHVLEVFRPGTSKWTMLRDHAETVGLDLDRILALGDGPNDIDLLRHAGLGVAMADGDEGARLAADRIAPPHDEDGVACVLEGLLDGSLQPSSTS